MSSRESGPTGGGARPSRPASGTVLQCTRGPPNPQSARTTVFTSNGSKASLTTSSRRVPGTDMPLSPRCISSHTLGSSRTANTVGRSDYYGCSLEPYYPTACHPPPSLSGPFVAVWPKQLPFYLSPPPTFHQFCPSCQPLVTPLVSI